MRKTCLTAIFILSCFAFVMAQEKTENRDTTSLAEDRPSRYQIGINSQFAIDGFLEQSIRTPIEVLIRRQTGTGGALRARILGISDHSTTEYIETLGRADVDRSTLGIALGYEWQRTLSRKWFWYYGLEIEGVRIWDNNTNKSIYFDEATLETLNMETVHKRITNRMGLLPLLGLKFQILPRLYLSTEAKILINNENYKYNRVTYFTRFDDGSYQSSPFSNESVKKQSFNFQPYTGIFINLTL